MAAAEFKIDVGPMLDHWLEWPTDFAQRVVFGRELSEWERKRVIAARWGYDVPPGTDRMEALREIGHRMKAAVGSSPRQAQRMRKREHLKMLRHFRQHPEQFPELEYRHRWIRSRCGKCRALYATETFISFRIAPGHPQPGRRTYVVERETRLDCGHPSYLLYPVEWEADGYVSPNVGADA